MKTMTIQAIQEAFHEQARQLVQKLHREARSQAFEKTIGTINDSLAAILGICDVKAREAVPFIKNAIISINTSLKEAYDYHTEYLHQGAIDVNNGCSNMCSIIQCHFLTHALVIKRDLANIKALARGDAEQFEQFLLYALLYFIAGTPSGETVEVKIATRQKDSQILVAIEKAGHPLSSEAIEVLKNKAKVAFPENHSEIGSHEASTRILLRLPFKFPDASESQVTLSTPRMKTK